MSIGFGSGINLNGHELENARLHNLSSHPTGVAGLVYYNTTDDVYYGYNGTTWINLSALLNFTNGDLAGDYLIPKVVHVTESTKTLTYNTEGNLATYSDSYGTKTFNYTDGVLTSITGTGKYQAKNLTYVNGNLTEVEVINNNDTFSSGSWLDTGVWNDSLTWNG